MDFMNSETVLNLNNIRASLIRMEDTILFNLIERSQFYLSSKVYVSKGIEIPGFKGSFLDWFLLAEERTHAQIRRYEAPDEVPFFPNDLPNPILPSLNYPPVLASYEAEININSIIKQAYIDEILPLISAGPLEQPENYGSTATCDIELLQALSRRIHFGKFVAEAKFQSETERFTALIKAQDSIGIDDAITNAAVEAKVLERIGEKTEVYAVEPNLKWSQKAQGKLSSKAAVKIYKDIVIPLTKKVEVDYLLRRLEDVE